MSDCKGVLQIGHKIKLLSGDSIQWKWNGDIHGDLVKAVTVTCGPDEEIVEIHPGYASDINIYRFIGIVEGFSIFLLPGEIIKRRIDSKWVGSASFCDENKTILCHLIYDPEIM